MKWLLLGTLILLCCTLWPWQFQSVKHLTPQHIVVYVQGEIEQPKEVQLPIGATIQDLLQHVQLKEHADLSTLNPYQVLHSKDTIIIAKLAPSQAPRISINLATAEQLESLPHIGASIAQRIVQYRETNGLFQTLEELKLVKGIGEATFQKIMDQICL